MNTATVADSLTDTLNPLPSYSNKFVRIRQIYFHWKRKINNDWFEGYSLKTENMTDPWKDLTVVFFSCRPGQLPVVCWLLFSGQSVAGDVSRWAPIGPGRGCCQSHHRLQLLFYSHLGLFVSPCCPFSVHMTMNVHYVMCPAVSLLAMSPYVMKVVQSFLLCYQTYYRADLVIFLLIF